jgi:hypothetical protein
MNGLYSLLTIRQLENLNGNAYLYRVIEKIETFRQRVHQFPFFPSEHEDLSPQALTQPLVIQLFQQQRPQLSQLQALGQCEVT